MAARSRPATSAGHRSAVLPRPVSHSAQVGPRKGDIVGAFRALDRHRPSRTTDADGRDDRRAAAVPLRDRAWLRQGVAQNGALFMANATRSRPGARRDERAGPTGSIGATYFEEYVIWMDCCMNAQACASGPDGRLSATSCRSTRRSSSPASRRAFRGLAVEARMEDDGQIHGAFTWALAARACAARPTTPARSRAPASRTTSSTSWRTFMTDEQRADPDVSPTSPTSGPTTTSCSPRRPNRYSMSPSTFHLRVVGRRYPDRYRQPAPQGQERDRAEPDIQGPNLEWVYTSSPCRSPS